MDLAQATDVVNAANALSLHNREACKATSTSGCYFCIRVFPSADISEFTDAAHDTALCPNCGMDAVLPGVTDPSLLSAAHLKWFVACPPL